jgi:hypothetical protein
MNHHTNSQDHPKLNMLVKGMVQMVTWDVRKNELQKGHTRY